METVLIEKLLNNGHGMTRTSEGAVVFVADALPGESVVLRNIEKRKGVLWAEADRGEDSPDRSVSPCSHYGACGGCQLLHVRRDRELHYKVLYLKDVLARLGKLTDVAVDAVDFPIESSRIRGKFHVDQEGRLGFKHQRDERIEEVPGCLVIPESVKALLTPLAEFCRRISFKGDIYFATDAQGENPHYEFRGHFPRSTSKKQLVLPGSAGLVLRDQGGRIRLKSGQARVSYDWNKLNVRLQPSRFFQANPASWPHFFALIDRYVETAHPIRVWDVHAGSGFLSSRLADTLLYASEPDPLARDQMEKGLTQAGFKLQVFAGTAEQAIKAEFFKAGPRDGVILDPPREGLSVPLRRWLRDEGPRKILYFSCDMGSFARDLVSLSEVYAPEGPILAMNLNPGTLRLETGVILKRKSKT